jgi:hypothetical protein
LIEPFGVIWVGLPEQASGGREANAKQDEDRHYAITPRELLALCPGPRGIVDRNLIDPVAEAQHAPGDLGFDVETIAPQAEPAHERGPHDLEAGLHVLDVAVEEDVGGGGDKAVADHEPVRVRAVTSEAAYAVHDVGAPPEDWRDQLAVIRGIVLEVGVLDYHQRCTYGGQTGADGGALALVGGVVLHRDAWIAGTPPRGGESPVRRAVVDDHDLLNARLLQNPAHDQLERPLLVVRGDDDPQNRVGAGHGRLV